MPDEWPFAHYEMGFLLPHFLEEGRGTIDVYFTRVHNPLWTNPDGFMWLKALKDHHKFGCHVALTPTWNESAWFADYVLPLGHSSERHDLMSQETHSGQWIAFRQPVARVAAERLGRKVRFTYETNPGQVWEENEFWIELSVRMDPDGKLGIRQEFESPYRPGEVITVDEYYRWIFENSVPGLPERAADEGLTAMEYMRKYGAFEITNENYEPFKDDGFKTPSKKLEFVSETMREWGWTEKEYVIPYPLESHVSTNAIDREKGEMLLLPNFRLPTLIHTRSANAKWLYELSHKNPIWMHPEDATGLGIDTGDLIKVETEIGYFVDSVWVTEGMRPGIIAMSHHLGWWRLQKDQGGNKGASNVVTLSDLGDGQFLMRVEERASAWESFDPDTSRIWWKDVGVHQNLTHAVHPDPVSGGHCWLQKAFNVSKAGVDDRHGDVYVDTRKSMEVYRSWLALTRPASIFSPDGTRRPFWLNRPLKPVREAYNLPK